MKFAQEHINSRYLIEAYEAGCIRIGNTEFRHSLLLMPEKLRDPWELQDLQDLSERHLSQLAAHQPDIILLGSGETQLFPHPSIFAPLMQAGIGYEVMPTPSACRTYNILLAEDRRVLAALIL
ncbi:Mth938-like domain-containing protein [Thiolapillus sp.]